MNKFLFSAFLLFALGGNKEIEAIDVISIFQKLLSGIIGTPAGGTPGSPCATSTNPALDATLSDSSLQFALNLYQQLQNQSNVFFSPYSIRMALAMVAAGAGGNTLTQMNSTLKLTGFPTQAQSNQAFLDLISSFCANPNYTLSSANRLYLQQSFPVLTSYVSTLKQFYQADAVNVDFQTAAAAATTQINSWVASQTNNTIPQLFTPGSLDASTILVIVNAIYFKGAWSTPFPVSATANQAFTPSTGPVVQVPMMKLVKASFPYYVSTALNSQVLQMNYAGDRLVMYLILPSTSSSLSSLQSALTAANFNEFRAGLVKQQVTVTIPKFTINFRQTLNTILQTLGMSDAFSTSLADFSGMATLTAGQKLFVSTVVHQAYVAVDEMGTTASAATGIGISTTSVELNPTTFVADRPFIYIIYDQQSKQIIFMGNVNNPKP